MFHVGEHGAVLGAKNKSGKMTALPPGLPLSTPDLLARLEGRRTIFNLFEPLRHGAKG